MPEKPKKPWRDEEKPWRQAETPKNDVDWGRVRQLQTEIKNIEETEYPIMSPDVWRDRNLEGGRHQTYLQTVDTIPRLKKMRELNNLFRKAGIKPED